MADDTRDLTPAVRDRIDAHLDAIDAVLRDAGLSHGERRTITDEVESQIREMLAARAGDSPTVADVEAILATLDPPESYAEEAVAPPAPPVTEAPPTPTSAETAPPPAIQPTEPARPKLSAAAVIGAIWACFFLFTIVAVVLWFTASFAAAPVDGGRAVARVAFFALVFLLPIVAGGVIGAFAPVGTTVLGFVAISRIRHSAGRLYGLGLAAFEALLFPLALLDTLFALGFLVLMKLLIFGSSGPYYIWEGLTAILMWPLPLALILCALVDWLIIRAVWRSVNRPVKG